MSYWALIVAVLSLMLAVKLAKFVGTLLVTALIIIYISLKKRRQ